MRVTEVRKAGSSDRCRPEMKTYDAGGQVCSITGERDGKPYTYVADIGYDEYGQRIYIKYGNGVETNYTYDENMRWLSHINTQNKYGTQYQNINYSFDDVGNVLGYKNDCMNGARYSTEQTYTYDALYQLIKAEGVTEDNPYAIPDSPDYRSNYEQNFSFDAIGNMTHKDSKETITPAKQKSGGDDLNYELTYEYDTNYAHRLTRAGSEQKGWRYYTYDDNGNVTSESDGVAPNEDTTTLTPVTVTTQTNEEGSSVYEADYAWAWPWSDSDTGSGKVSPNNKRIYEWNSRNLLMRSVALGYDTRYAYGADGNRAAKWTAGNLSETLYFNTMWTWHIEKGLSQEQQGQYSKHIYLGETRIVTKQTSDLEEHYGQSEEKRHQYYYHPDHLGSAQLVTDYEGDEYQRIEYTPYGELWVEKKTANEKDMRYLPYKFTAKEQDEETGLYYYGARYLDAKYSRWLSADPAVNNYINGNSTSGGLYNTVNFNLYHYAGNNPIKYIDPDGKDSGFVMDEDSVGHLGHAGMYVQTKEGYSYFEVTGIKKDEKVGGTISGKKKTEILSKSPLSFPAASSVDTANNVSKKETDLYSGVVRRDFADKNELLEYLKKAGDNDGYNSIVSFETTPEEDKLIYDTAMKAGKSFSNYSAIGNNCGTWARDVLTTPGTGLFQIYTPDIDIYGILNKNAPNMIGDQLYLSNQSRAKYLRIEK